MTMHFSGNSNSQSTKNDVDESTDKKERSAESSGRSMQPEQFRKVFIGGLNYRTTEIMLREYFSKFGNIVDCVVMQDQNGRSRGFGFVTYSKPAMVDELMRNRPHMIDRREVDVKRAMPKESGTPEIRLAVKKIFIGAIREGLTEEDLKEYFGKYGVITDCVVMRDTNGLLRGFGFVEYDDCDPVDRIVLEKHHVVNGQSLDVKKAVPKKVGEGGGRRSGGNMSGGFGPGPYAQNSRSFAGSSFEFFGRNSGSEYGNRRGSSFSGRGGMNLRSNDREGYGSMGRRGNNSMLDDYRMPNKRNSLRENSIGGPTRNMYNQGRQMCFDDDFSRGRPDQSNLGFEDFGNDSYGNEPQGRFGSYPQRGGSNSGNRFQRDQMKSPGYGGPNNRNSFGGAPWNQQQDRYGRREEGSAFFENRSESPVRDFDRVNPRMRMSDNREGMNQNLDRNYGSGGMNNGGSSGNYMNDMHGPPRPAINSSRQGSFPNSANPNGQNGPGYNNNRFGAGPSNGRNVGFGGGRFNYGSQNNFNDGYDVSGKPIMSSNRANECPGRL